MQTTCAIRQEGLKARRWARGKARARVRGGYLALGSEQAPGSRISSVLLKLETRRFLVERITRAINKGIELVNISPR